MKKWYLIILLPLVYAYGVATVYLKIFPYYEVQEAKNWIDERNVEEIRVHDTSHLKPATGLESFDKKLVFLTYGQSNAANTGQLGYQVRNPVFMVFDGISYPYEDPSLGATGTNGSVWGRVGDELIDRGMAEAVFFVNAAWGGASMGELARAHQYDFFEKQLVDAKETFGKIDGVLIHHGERHNKNIMLRKSIGVADYDEAFREFLAKVRTITDAPFYLSQASYCGDRGSDADVLLVQDELIKSLDGVYRGPNTDNLLGPVIRLPDLCHFSPAGLDTLSDAWVEAIIARSET